MTETKTFETLNPSKLAPLTKENGHTFRLQAEPTVHSTEKFYMHDFYIFPTLYVAPVAYLSCLLKVLGMCARKPASSSTSTIVPRYKKSRSVWLEFVWENKKLSI